MATNGIIGFRYKNKNYFMFSSGDMYPGFHTEEFIEFIKSCTINEIKSFVKCLVPISDENQIIAMPDKNLHAKDKNKKFIDFLRDFGVYYDYKDGKVLFYDGTLFSDVEYVYLINLDANLFEFGHYNFRAFKNRKDNKPIAMKLPLDQFYEKDVSKIMFRIKLYD